MVNILDLKVYAFIQESNLLMCLGDKDNKSAKPILSLFSVTYTLAVIFLFLLACLCMFF